MKSKKILLGVCISLVLGLGLGIWWNMPSILVDMEASEVSKISVFDGNTGRSMTLTEASDIEHLVENFNRVSLKKEGLSWGYMGYGYRITMYRANDVVYKEFIVNSNESIRKDPFFYRASQEKIDYTYIKNLFDGDA